MPRAENIFFNLVTDENSTTELLCNLMRFAAFRLPFLRQFLSEEAATSALWEDFDTQVGIAGSGIPDLHICGKDLSVLLEIKIVPGLGLTENQPDRYLEFLRTQDVRERWLVFLVPRRWQHRDELNRRLALVAGGQSSRATVHTRTIYWEDVIDIIEKNDLATLNPFINDFCELLVARFGPKLVAFTSKEILMLFSSDIPAALSNLQQLVDGVRDRSSIYKVKPSASRSLCPSEYGMYFLDRKDRGAFWFGVWTEFWKANGVPLCFGVTENASETVRQAFLTNYKGQTKHFQKYIVGWFAPEDLTGEDIVDRVWTRLSPLVEATIAASSNEP